MGYLLMNEHQTKSYTTQRMIELHAQHVSTTSRLLVNIGSIAAIEECPRVDGYGKTTMDVCIHIHGARFKVVEDYDTVLKCMSAERKPS